VTAVSKFKDRAITVLVTVGIALPLALGFSAVQVSNARDTSTQNLCDAINLAVNGGMRRLIDAARAQAATSKQRTAEEKAAAERNYKLILDSFPELDCDANPIVVKVIPTVKPSTTSTSQG
jgi:hypothetical protein